MNKHHKIIIAGAGGIAEAVGLILAEWSTATPAIFIGNRTIDKAQKVAKWIEESSTKPCSIKTFHLAEKGITKEMKTIFEECDILLDCLPGGLAPKMAQFAKDHQLHYANLTEYVDETNEIISLAKNAKTGFILQTGLAPGYIDVLANKLFQDFCKDFKVEKVDTLEFKVGALTDHAVSPHYYGFTWSPVGVATEYIKDAIVIRDYKKTTLPSLSERAKIIIDGITYEEDLTSGGAADLPDALSGKVRLLDYKTIRYPGHYEWIQNQVESIGKGKDIVRTLQKNMEQHIPHIEDDQIILYAAVQGYDVDGVLHRREVSRKILPKKVGKHQLRAIQVTTAVPLIQSAQLLLESSYTGVILQSQIDPNRFLMGDYITPVYGKI
ncbi:saccharopine dehydrogenase C-terminal domain-containing protein [Aquimarina gracilis]|uniref:Saccharopine dehydrogenase C-terminal domain-containing protein n=1 Tax=Aquimarina gracilis TaxID=874422 RepID=A0ABU5ZTM0_9FLAO|nr:saccharopine dehydrogenase C-terminal domain-containing protein [Aquimarina gracilis]MEB3345323.1 saccharopine dehydrogenase C-terminal domain-containing protein [Aquimarina gracilis]